MTRVVGQRIRDEFVVDPRQAWQRGQVLDRFLAGAGAPVARGVKRATHREFNAIDDARQLAQARVLNGRRSAAASDP